MVSVKMVASLIGEDGEAWHSGEVHEASVQFARKLIYDGKATAVVDLPPAPPLTSRLFTTAADPVPATRDPVKPKGKK
jgi:hypothetical protein